MQARASVSVAARADLRRRGREGGGIGDRERGRGGDAGAGKGGSRARGERRRGRRGNAHLEVEGAVHAVLLRAVDGREVMSHGSRSRGGGPASRSFSCESRIDGTRAECVGEGVVRDDGVSRVYVSSYVSFAVPSGGAGRCARSRGPEERVCRTTTEAQSYENSEVAFGASRRKP